MPRGVDVGDTRFLVETLADADVAVCVVPYSMILTCTRAAIETGARMVDLGGHTDTVLQQLELDGKAETAGVTIVPDCGMSWLAGPPIQEVQYRTSGERDREAARQRRPARPW